MEAPLDVFISYAPADQDLCDELKEHLALLVREGGLRAWDRGRVGLGELYRQRIAEHLAAAPVVVLLLSASYFASDAQYETELAPAIERARADKAKVIPVLARACDWRAALLDTLTLLPRNGVAVESWPKRDEAWSDIVLAIRQAIGRLPQTAAAFKITTAEPAYESAEIKALAEQLDRARNRRGALEEAGTSTADVDREILDLRRRLREGGHLRAGDALADGRYLLLQQIGQGGFASVWHARDRQRDERVAIKVLHPALAREPSRRERFFRGARVMAQLEHPAVVRVLEPHGEDGGYLYFVMELVDGADLHRAVIEKRLRPEDVVPLILRVGDALAEAHAKRIVHRDVKPANVLLDASGMPRLTDFDLVAAKDTTGGTRTGAMGTFLFTAPEQINKAKEADARADVYGLAMTAIFCLHGSDLPASAVRRPDKVIAALPCGEAIKAVLTRGIEVEPGDRHAEARAFCEALREALATGEQGEIESESMPSKPVLPDRRTVERRSASLKSFHALVRTLESKLRRSGKYILILGFGTVLGTILWMYLDSYATSLVSTLAATSRWPDAGGAASVSASVVTVSAAASVIAPPPPSGPCPDDMVLIPAGVLTMGSIDGEPDEKPPHKVKLSAFCMDKTEVTVAAYRQCTKAARGSLQCTEPSVGGSCNWDKTDRGRHPVNCVDWDQANTYCRWSGGVLPTEAQWEYAARGAEGRKYPWGDASPSEQLCWDGEGSDIGKGRRQVSCPAGRYEAGATPLGLLDMAGNVWEWVADWYAPYPADGKTIPEDPKRPEKAPSEPRRVMRGGGWDNVDASRARAAYRGWGDVSVRDIGIGFRCARRPK